MYVPRHSASASRPGNTIDQALCSRQADMKAYDLHRYRGSMADGTNVTFLTGRQR